MTVTPDRRDRIVMLCAATAVFVATTFSSSFSLLEFMNDHFVHLSRGRQILLGEVPGARLL